MNGNNTYKERQTVKNKGELLFEEYCKSKGHKFYKIGFSEKTNEIEKYYIINKYIRNIPDYFVESAKGCFVVNVKGTGNFKQEEIEMLPFFVKNYSTKECPLIYAFCMENQPVYILRPKQLMEKYYRAEDKVWESDGKVYRNLSLE
jgi:hypothetical protein